MSNQELAARLAALEAENAALKAAATAKHKLIITEKGCIGLTGLRQFPVSFYVGEWEAILGMADKIKAFAQANASEIAKRNKQNQN